MIGSALPHQYAKSAVPPGLGLTRTQILDREFGGVGLGVVGIRRRRPGRRIGDRGGWRGWCSSGPLGTKCPDRRPRHRFMGGLPDQIRGQREDRRCGDLEATHDEIERDDGGNERTDDPCAPGSGLRTGRTNGRSWRRVLLAARASRRRVSRWRLRWRSRTTARQRQKIVGERCEQRTDTAIASTVCSMRSSATRSSGSGRDGRRSARRYRRGGARHRSATPAQRDRRRYRCRAVAVRPPPPNRGC